MISRTRKALFNSAIILRNLRKWNKHSSVFIARILNLTLEVEVTIQILLKNEGTLIEPF